QAKRPQAKRPQAKRSQPVIQRVEAIITIAMRPPFPPLIFL
ncbi:MAG: hypothetical protein ACI8VT_002765, partial [Saprospiraceae bacterium]